MSAPVFPSLIAATPSRFGPAHTANGVGFQIAAAVLGQSLLPALIGLMARKLGLEIIGPALFFSVLALGGLHFSGLGGSARTARDRLTVLPRQLPRLRN